jgi:hypothetical protein
MMPRWGRRERSEVHVVREPSWLLAKRCGTIQGRCSTRQGAVCATPGGCFVRVLIRSFSSHILVLRWCRTFGPASIGRGIQLAFRHGHGHGHGHDVPPSCMSSMFVGAIRHT